MTLEANLTEEYLNSVVEKAKKSTTEYLHEAIKIYLENLIKNNCGDFSNLEQEISTHEEFAIYEKEIIEREIKENGNLPFEQQKRSAYLVGFGDLLVRAKIIESHPYDITDRRLIN
jgi:hypothetical protein